MPVKWDAEKDKHLLVCLITDANLNISNDVLDGMIQKWPSSFGEAPTRRAISEHFIKIKKSQPNATGANPSFSTPKKSGPGARATPMKGNKTKTPSSGKRKQKLNKDDEEDDDGMLGGIGKGELSGLEGVADGSPSKRQRTKVKYEDSEDEGMRDESTGSEYNGLEDGMF